MRELDSSVRKQIKELLLQHTVMMITLEASECHDEEIANARENIGENDKFEDVILEYLLTLTK